MQKTIIRPVPLPHDVERNLELMERTAAAALKGPRGKPQVRALFALVRMGGVAAQSEVEQRLQVHSSQITRYVESLVNEKLIARDRDSGPDRRKVVLRVTPKGLNFVLGVMSPETPNMSPDALMLRPDGTVTLLQIKKPTK